MCCKTGRFCLLLTYNDSVSRTLVLPRISGIFPASAVCSRLIREPLARVGHALMDRRFGEVAERLNATVLKTVGG